MSRGALLSMESESAQSSQSRHAGGLRVSQPGDSFETEAEHVAETVSAGGRVSGWSIIPGGAGASSAGVVQRQAAPGAGGAATAPGAQSTDPAAMLGKLGEAFMATPAGKRVLAIVADSAEAKALETPAGVIVAGSAAVGAVAALAKANKPLPLQIPKIPLDFAHPGLAVKIDYQGPVDKPTSASFVLSYAAKPVAATSKKPANGAVAADIERLKAEQKMFEPKAKPLLGPRADMGQVKTPEQRGFEAWQAARLAEIGRPVAVKPEPKAPAAAGVPAAAEKPKAAPIIEKKPDPRAPAPEAKKEEPTVQRMAASSEAIPADSTSVDTAMASSGHPLDRETRRYMESRIGFDFGKVRLHTDSHANASAKALSAHAYTVGSNIVFAPGRYAPQTTAGRRLLAHELTHVVQQTASPKAAHPAIRRAPAQVQRWTGPIEYVKNKLMAKVQKLPGYSLFCVIIEKDLVTGEHVDRNAGNLIKGVLELTGDTGKQVLEQLQAAEAAIQRGYDWLTGEITALQLTAEYFNDLAQKALGAVDITDLDGSFENIKTILREPYDKLVTLAKHAGNKLLEFVIEVALEAVGATGLMDIFRKGQDTIKLILKDPGAFLGHLIDAVVKGATQFKDNIATYLKDAVVSWMFGAVNLKMPKKFDAAGIMNLILQVLGLTYANVKKKLIVAFGDGGEEIVAFLEGALDVVKAIYHGGLGAAADLILSKAEGLIDTVLDSVRNWAITKLVVAGITKLAAMFSPVTGLINVVTVVYKIVTYIMDKAKAFKALIATVVDSVSKVANGQIDDAANAIEKTMAGTLPLMMSFLASVLGLDGVGERIKETIKTVQGKVSDALDKVIGYLVEKGKALWEKAKDGFANAVEWWKRRKKFKLGDEEHDLYTDGDENNHVLMVASKAPTTIEKFVGAMVGPEDDKQAIRDLAAKLKNRKRELKEKDGATDGGDALFQELLDRISKLASLAGTDRPKSKIEPMPGSGAFGGSPGVDAFLSLNHPVGTEPDKGSDPPLWKDLGPLEKKKHYIRGHLLSQRLGGQGVWENMIPLTNDANQTHYHAAEKQLIDTISTGTKLVHYQIKPQYDASITDPKTPEDAEKRLVKLHWEYRPAAYVNGSWDDQKDPKAAEKDSGDVDPKQSSG